MVAGAGLFVWYAVFYREKLNQIRTRSEFATQVAVRSRLGWANLGLPYDDVVSNHEELCHPLPSWTSMKSVPG
jgi:hypothetical protein